MTDLLCLEDVHAGYGATTVVRDLDLRVGSGEIVSLLGPNGAGKTTTLLTTIGVLPVVSGTIMFRGSPIQSGRPLRNIRAGLGLLPEGRALFRNLSARETLRLGVRKGPISLQSVLSYFPQLEPILDRRTALLSGGEQQMLALARLLVANPQLLMIDEMSLGLAPAVFGSILPVIRTTTKEHGLGVLLVEQHADLALKNSDRAYVLVHGSVQSQGPSSELLRQSSLRSLYLGGGAGDGPGTGAEPPESPASAPTKFDPHARTSNG